MSHGAGRIPRAVLLGQAVFCVLFPHHPGVLLKHLKAEHSLGPEGLIAGSLLFKVSLKRKGKWGRRTSGDSPA